MTAKDDENPTVKESEVDRVDPDVRPYGRPRRDGFFLSRVDPLPEQIEKDDPIARPLYHGDKAHQETIWDRSQTPRGEDYESPASTAIEPHPIDVDVPPIDEPGCLSHYVEYDCGSCNEWCLEPETSEHAQNKLCRRCNSVPF